ncbi:MAG: hypothetical protein KDD89_00915 [Anaerolineales bacterium]|nr:hypothetical protein [Anaerolineales bacterium]
MPLDNYPVPSSGINYETPLITWIQAAHWDNMSYSEFARKSPAYQSMIAAAYLALNRAEAVKSWQERKK